MARRACISCLSWVRQLVYLYLINYAKTQPELTLLAVNTFVKDAKVCVLCSHAVRQRSTRAFGSRS
jgi:hypothetical protein